MLKTIGLSYSLVKVLILNQFFIILIILYFKFLINNKLQLL